MTLRWREMDSNHRFRARMGVGDEQQVEIAGVGREEEP
jgi:hypothetical protein